MSKFIPRSLQQAIENERKHIASHLHDGLGQSLTMLKLRVEQALIKLESEQQDEAKAILIDVVMQLRRAVGEVRSIAAELRPSMLDDLGLIPTIQWLSRQFHAAHPKILVQLEIAIAEDNIPVELKTVVFRLIQEALNNVAKHSGANSVFVYLRSHESHLLVGIVDNGCGFDSDQILSAGYCLLGVGVNSMRERVEISDGRFKIRSRLGTGTAVTAVWGVQPDFSQSDMDIFDSFSPHNSASALLDLDLSSLG